MNKPGVIWGGILVAALGISFTSSMGGNVGQSANPGEQFNIHKMAGGSLRDAGRSMIRNFGEIPLSFIPNRGQVDEQALFYSVTPRYTLWMTKEGLVFDAAIRERSRDDLAKKMAMASGDTESVLRAEASEDQPAECRRDVSRLVFVGANKDSEIIPLEPTEHRANYFIGRDPAKWQTDIPTSLAVLYKEIYPGIDLKVYGRESQIEYDWVVKPGARAADIRLEYRDVDEATLDAEGNLIIATRFGQITHHRPISYQRLDGRRIDVASKFVKCGEESFGFDVDSYEPTRDLIIDPVLVYSTYLGGSGDDFARDIAVDATGAVYVVGWTNSSDFPLKSSYQNTIKGNSDIFITKFSPSGKSLVFSTLLGGSELDEAYAIAIDSNGSAYITGKTWSYDFPLMNAFQQFGRGIFVAKIASPGNRLVFSTHLSDGMHDCGRDIAVDSSGSAYITGRTSSSNFPLQNPFQSTKKPFFRTAFVTKFSPAGDALVYSTFLGGSIWDEGRAIALDSKGRAYVAGLTDSPDFPLLNPLQHKIGGNVDVFVTKFSPEGNTLVYSTYLGGRWWDWPYGIDVDGSGAAFIAGETYSWDFPVKNAYQKTNAGLLDVFVAKLAPAGKSLSFSTYLGGSSYDGGYAVAVDKTGAVHVTGETWSTDFPLQAPYQKAGTEGDVFVLKLQASGTRLVCSTLLGGNHSDRGLAIVSDRAGAVYVAGDTYSTDFPLALSYQKTNKGSCDTFISKLNFSSATLTVRSPDGGETLKRGSTQTIQWDYLGQVGSTVKIELLQGSKLSAVIAPGAPMGMNGKGTHKWKVPLTQPAGEDFRIRITSLKDKSCVDVSDGYFLISD